MSRMAGAAVPPWQEGRGSDIPLLVTLDLALASTEAHTIIIKGHTHCGANAGMINALLEGVPQDTKALTRWMLPVAAEGLQEALQQARDDGTPKREMGRLTEQITVLQSMSNLYGYYINDQSVRDLVESGNLQIIGAIRELEKGPDGKQKLYIFDPEERQFRDLDEIYREAGSPSMEQMESYATDLRVRSLLSQHYQPPTSLVMQQGARSHTVAELDYEAIHHGIRNLLDQLRRAGRS